MTTNPLPLGKLAPGAGRVAVTSNVSAEIGANPMVSDLVIQAHPDNGAGRIYVLNTSAAPDLVNFANVLRILEPGQFYSAAGRAGTVNGVDSRNYYLANSDGAAYAIGEVREG
jgi:hypothetical protein